MFRSHLLVAYSRVFFCFKKTERDATVSLFLIVR
jgi:hypothetical protein